MEEAGATASSRRLRLRSRRGKVRTERRRPQSRGQTHWASAERPVVDGLVAVASVRDTSVAPAAGPPPGRVMDQRGAVRHSAGDRSHAGRCDFWITRHVGCSGQRDTDRRPRGIPGTDSAVPVWCMLRRRSNGSAHGNGGLGRVAATRTSGSGRPAAPCLTRAVRQSACVGGCGARKDTRPATFRAPACDRRSAPQGAFG